MKLRKTTVDNNVKNVSKIVQSHNEQAPQFSKERKRNASKNKFSQKIYKLLKNVKKTIIFQFQHQAIGLPWEVQKPLTNNKNY